MHGNGVFVYIDQLHGCYIVSGICAVNAGEGGAADRWGGGGGLEDQECS